MNMRENIAPWDNYPKLLSFKEILNPIQVLEQFFLSGWPDDHLRELESWYRCVMSVEVFAAKGKDAGYLNLIYEGSARLMEALYILSLQHRLNWPQPQKADKLQITIEKTTRAYLSNDLSVMSLRDPYTALVKIFNQISLNHFRHYLHSWLTIAFSAIEGSKLLNREESKAVFLQMRQLYFIAWVIYQRNSPHPFIGERWQLPVQGSQVNQGIFCSPDPCKAEIETLRKITGIITGRATSISAVYLFGIHRSPLFYYLLVLTADGEKTREHELVNMLEDECFKVNPAFLIVHRLQTAHTEINKGNYFFNDILGNGLCLYAAPGMEMVKTLQINRAERLVKAQCSFNRWAVQAEQFYNGAVRHMENDASGPAIFLLNQAAESVLIALINALLGCRISAHNLFRMIRLTLLLTDKVAVIWELETPAGVRLLRQLQKSYSEARYDPEFRIEKTSMETIRQKVRLMITAARVVYSSYLKKAGTK